MAVFGFISPEEAAQLRATIAAQDAEIEKLKKELEAAEKKATTAQSDADFFEKRYNLKKEAHETLSKSYNALVTENSSKDEKISQLSEQCRKVTEEAEKKQAKIDAQSRLLEFANSETTVSFDEAIAGICKSVWENRHNSYNCYNSGQHAVVNEYVSENQNSIVNSGELHIDITSEEAFHHGSAAGIDGECFFFTDEFLKELGDRKMNVSVLVCCKRYDKEGYYAGYYEFTIKMDKFQSTPVYPDGRLQSHTRTYEMLYLSSVPFFFPKSAPIDLTNPNRYGSRESDFPSAEALECMVIKIPSNFKVTHVSLILSVDYR